MEKKMEKPESLFSNNLNKEISDVQMERGYNSFKNKNQTMNNHSFIVSWQQPVNINNEKN